LPGGGLQQQELICSAMIKIPASEWGIESFSRRKKLSRDEVIRRLRIGDLNKLLAYRYGGGDRVGWQFPDDDAGLEDLKILAHHYHPVALPRIIKLRAPWADAEAIINEVEGDPKRYRARHLGKLLNLSGLEYRQIGPFRTINPVNMSAEERAEYSRIRSNERRRQKRRMQGMKSRAEYEGKSLSRAKPWAAEGISKATWYRRQAKEQTESKRETSLAEIKLSTQTRPVSQGWDVTTYWSHTIREEIDEELKMWVFARATPQKPLPPELCQVAA
jgi:hypothetical protein